MKWLEPAGKCPECESLAAELAMEQQFNHALQQDLNQARDLLRKTEARLADHIAFLQDNPIIIINDIPQ